YFGLRYTTSSGAKRWLDPSKSVIRQLKDGQPMSVHLAVKFYAADPCKLVEEITRYQYFLQIKQDIAQGRLPIPFELAVELFALCVQSELGDYDPERHVDNYVAEFQFLPNQSLELERQAAAFHRVRLAGQVPPVAELNFLERCKWLDMYGCHTYPIVYSDSTTRRRHKSQDAKHRKQAKPAKNQSPLEINYASDQLQMTTAEDEYALGLNPSAVLVLRNKQKIAAYPWHRITRTRRQCRCFLLDVLEPNNEVNTYGFRLINKQEARELKGAVAEHIEFVRLSRVHVSSSLARARARTPNGSSTQQQPHTQHAVFGNDGLPVGVPPACELSVANVQRVPPDEPLGFGRRFRQSLRSVATSVTSVSSRRTVGAMMGSWGHSNRNSKHGQQQRRRHRSSTLATGVPDVYGNRAPPEVVRRPSMRRRTNTIANANNNTDTHMRHEVLRETGYLLASGQQSTYQQQQQQHYSTFNGNSTSSAIVVPAGQHAPTNAGIHRAGQQPRRTHSTVLRAAPPEIDHLVRNNNNSNLSHAATLGSRRSHHHQQQQQQQQQQHLSNQLIAKSAPVARSMLSIHNHGEPKQAPSTKPKPALFLKPDNFSRPSMPLAGQPGATTTTLTDYDDADADEDEEEEEERSTMALIDNDKLDSRFRMARARLTSATHRSDYSSRSSTPSSSSSLLSCCSSLHDHRGLGSNNRDIDQQCCPDCKSASVVSSAYTTGQTTYNSNSNSSNNNNYYSDHNNNQSSRTNPRSHRIHHRRHHQSHHRDTSTQQHAASIQSHASVSANKSALVDKQTTTNRRHAWSDKQEQQSFVAAADHKSLGNGNANVNSWELSQHQRSTFHAPPMQSIGSIINQSMTPYGSNNQQQLSMVSKLAHSKPGGLTATPIVLAMNAAGELLAANGDHGVLAKRRHSSSGSGSASASTSSGCGGGSSNSTQGAYNRNATGIGVNKHDSDTSHDASWTPPSSGSSATNTTIANSGTTGTPSHAKNKRTDQSPAWRNQLTSELKRHMDVTASRATAPTNAFATAQDMSGQAFNVKYVSFDV
ncbi:Band 4.1-like protein 4A, partial [Fragariocoptes setiger]